MKLNLRSHVLGGIDPVLLAKDLGLDPDPWQESMLRSTRKRVHVLVHRQGGKSTTTAVLALHQALYFANTLTLIISPSLHQSQEVFRKVRAFYALRGKPVAPEQENLLSLSLENGSRVIALPGSEGTIRGYSANLLIIDEGARVGDDIFASILPMVAVTKGRVIALSTPSGRRGWFYVASKSLRWEHFRVTGDQCPRLNAAELEEERELLGDLAYRQEYDCEFVDAAGAAFGGEDIEAMFAGSPVQPPARQLSVPAQPAQSRQDRATNREIARIMRSRGTFGGDAGTCRHGVSGRCIRCVSGQAR